ncbi:phosphonoacetaldehyde hydrolase-like isoform X2 [Apostichopus japonicus]|uniref:phosphonoacetaldehyde hydrolase-like isoform X2 n=1 Tax=Stichopus japonicus TaxID=307972 RepID=UPI003AB3CA05
MTSPCDFPFRTVQSGSRTFVTIDFLSSLEAENKRNKLASLTRSYNQGSQTNFTECCQILCLAMSFQTGYIWTNARMPYRVVQRYQGPLKAVVFDWAGTVVDCGVIAPVIAFQQVFEDEGVPITDEETRGPMGTHKRTHIETVLGYESVRKRWNTKHGKDPTGQDIDRMYQNFVPKQKESLKEHCNVISGAVKTVNHLRTKYKLKIGSSTGFTKPIMETLSPIATKQGYTPEFCATSDMAPRGRPSPNLLWLNAVHLDVSPIESIVKVDDTAGGITEGLTAGCWAVGVAKTGNYMAATEEQLAKMEKGEYSKKLQAAYDKLTQAGAHYVIDSINDLPGVIEDINRRLACGEKP